MHPWLWLTILDCKHCYFFFSCFPVFLQFRASSLWLWNELHTERPTAARTALWYTLTPLKTKNNESVYKPPKKKERKTKRKTKQKKSNKRKHHHHHQLKKQFSFVFSKDFFGLFCTGLEHLYCLATCLRHLLEYFVKPFYQLLWLTWDCGEGVGEGLAMMTFYLFQSWNYLSEWWNSNKTFKADAWTWEINSKSRK